MEETEMGQERPRAFLTTHWSVVLEASDADPDRRLKALSELCDTYWYPIYAYVRRQGRSPHDAQDLTQGFFAKMLSRDALARVDQARGKFRSFLLASLKNYLTDQARRAGAQKRGGETTILALDELAAEARFEKEPCHDLSPDKVFERSWVTTLLEQVMTTLDNEQRRAGKGHVFDKLRGCIVKSGESPSYVDLASQLAMTEAVVRKSVQRLRQRYGLLLRAEIGKTVAAPEQIDEEIKGLFEAWR